ncbi:hypothetical protein [Pararhizobium sp. LjRoot238]|uniref:hypothetical protein n=1 Tax=Pararhizobium sp. LjRoot238 TaxID=3342293 RepID=UPI003ECC19B9
MGDGVTLPGATHPNQMPLIERIIAQTERLVPVGEAVPAGDKLVSLFEPHADIIVKGIWRPLKPVNSTRSINKKSSSTLVRRSFLLDGLHGQICKSHLVAGA